METPQQPKDKRLLIPRANGFGWDLNWDNKWSYTVLAIILIIPFAVVAFALLTK